MAKSQQSLVQDKIGDMTECSICAEIFTHPKILPCVHTFCLKCLETYGKDKQPGDQISCPICRYEFAIPKGGFCNLPNNFLIGNLVEIGKLSMAPVNEAMCNICPEGEEIIAKHYCVDCEQIICERCSKSHKKTKSCQNHEVIELGSKLNAQNFNLRNSYCDHHPKELIKMYCYDDNVAICLICCVESHQTHRCVNVDKAAEEFTKRLKADLEKVTMRLPECEEVGENLDKYKKEFLKEISKAEESIRDTATKLKELIGQHTEILVQNLKSVMEHNIKAFEITKQNAERFKMMIDSFSRYSEELLSRGSPVDICRAADQTHTRANELEKLSSNCSGDRLRSNTVVFQPSGFENLLKQCRSNNAVGEITVSESSDQKIQHDEIEGAISQLDAIWTNRPTRNLVPLPGFITVTTEEPDMLTLDNDPTQKRAKMPCGHVIGPGTMMDYCKALLENRKCKFYCPAVDCFGSEICRREWEYFLVRHVACLSPDEMYEVEKKIADNYLRKAMARDQFKKCPGCQIWCFRASDVRNSCVRCPVCTKTKGGAGFTFCWACEKNWQSSSCSGVCGTPGCAGKDGRLYVLATCPTKWLNGCVKCPCIRGCPDCGCLIEHKSNGVDNLNIFCYECRLSFCFICLKELKYGKSQCQPYDSACKLAPRQASLPGRL